MILIDIDYHYQLNHTLNGYAIKNIKKTLVDNQSYLK